MFDKCIGGGGLGKNQPNPNPFVQTLGLGDFLDVWGREIVIEVHDREG